MDNQPDISIVIVNYNVKDFLLECLRSIRESAKGLKVEVIVVDNNSTDGSVEFLEPLFPEVKFISLKENIGFGKANNLAFKDSSGKYILVLNPDTILEENNLSVMKEFMDNNPGTGISGCKVLNPDGTFQLACRRGFPTPWAAFSKLFGLQKLFPKSAIFAKYNQTFRSVDDTYNIDSVIGAYMFCRKSVIDELNGFDPDFFMYGEDLDLCLRANRAGWKVTYVHSSSIIHFKGESTKRSTINEVKHFYQAMEIYARKHYSGSFIFLLILKMAIWLRSIIAYGNKFRRDILLILTDLLIINGTLIVSTKLRFGEYFDFPDYAYPTVFIVVSLVLFITMSASGAYFERIHSVRRSFFALILSFFILASLTYFFREYGFSRGILLSTIGSTIFLSSISRILLKIFDKLAGKDSDRRIIIAGINTYTDTIIDELTSGDKLNADIVGVVSTNNEYNKLKNKVPILGNFEHLPEIIKERKANEIVITDQFIKKHKLISIISAVSDPNVRFHIAGGVEDLLVSKIVNDISGFDAAFRSNNIISFRYRFYKRIFDVILAFFFLTFAFPVIYTKFSNISEFLKQIKLVIFGKYSVVGTYPQNKGYDSYVKPGLTGLVHINRPEQLSEETKIKLDEYYIQNAGLSFDIDILLKYIFRKSSGN